MNQQSTVRIVTVKDLWDIFANRRLIILLAAAAAVVGLFLCVQLTASPKYESTATLYIMRQGDGETASSASTDFSLALNAVRDCTYLLKSHSVVEAVIEELNLDQTYEALAKCISTNNPEGTRVLEVTVRWDSPEQAKLIADSICRIGAEKIAEAMGFHQVNLYEHATASGKPSGRVGLIVYVLTGIAGAVIAYFVCLAAFLLDDHIRSKEDAERLLGLPILGGIPDVNRGKKQRRGANYSPAKSAGRNPEPVQLKAAGEDDSSAQESYRVLRANLQFCGQDVRTVAVTSCNEQEGKTTVALNLAKALSELTKRVLVIDADLRRPAGTPRRANAKGAEGLSEVLTGAARLDACIRRTQYEFLHVLPAGTYPPNPAELLHGPCFAALLTEARKYYDYIIVDTPPLGQVIDAAVAASRCDGAVLVLRNGMVRCAEAWEVTDQLEKSGTKILGVVQNCV